MQQKESSQPRTLATDKWLPLVVIILGLSGYVGFKWIRGQESSPVALERLLNQECQFSSGDRVRLGEEVSKHKLTILHFWASWCPPCIDEIPRLVTFHNQYGALGVAVLAVNTDEEKSLEHIGRFRKRFNWNFLDVTDPLSRLYAATGFQALPSTMIFSKTGELLYKQSGDLAWDSQPFHTQVLKWLD